MDHLLTLPNLLRLAIDTTERTAITVPTPCSWQWCRRADTVADYTPRATRHGVLPNGVTAPVTCPDPGALALTTAGILARRVRPAEFALRWAATHHLSLR